MSTVNTVPQFVSRAPGPQTNDEWLELARFLSNLRLRSNASVGGVTASSPLASDGGAIPNITAPGLAAVATSGSASDLGSGTLPAARLPNPSASTLGGVESIAVVPRKFLTGISTSGVPSQDQPTDADLSVSDITTNNASTSAHGFVAKLPNDATKYYDGTGAYTVPAGSGAVSTQSANLAGSRVLGTVYQNTSGRPMFVSTSCNTSGSTTSNPGLTEFFTDSSNPPTTRVQYGAFSSTSAASTFSIVLPGNYYKLNGAPSSGVAAILLWFEWT